MSLGDDGWFGCSCPAWRFSKKDAAIGRRNDCKHIVALRDGLTSLVVQKAKRAAVAPTVIAPTAPVVMPFPSRGKPAVLGGRFGGLELDPAAVVELARSGARFRALEFDFTPQAA